MLLRKLSRLKLNRILVGDKSRLWVQKNAYIEFNQSSKIILKGDLNFGQSWSEKSYYSSLICLGKNAVIEVEKKFTIYEGARIFINDNAQFKLGEGFINSSANISCFDKIEIGKNCVISENVLIRDSDNHTILNGEKTKPIIIKDNVWIGVNVTILKGVTINEGAVIAAGSLVVNDVKKNCLVGGVPAKILKENVSWER